MNLKNENNSIVKIEYLTDEVIKMIKDTSSVIEVNTLGNGMYSVVLTLSEYMKYVRKLNK